MDEVNANQFELSTRFNYSQAIVWQIKFIISCFLSKKALGAASAELQYVSPSRTILFLIHDGVIDCMCHTIIESMLTFLSVVVRKIWHRLRQIPHQGAGRVNRS